MVLDDAFKLMGSNNWTRGSAENSEQLNLVPRLSPRRMPGRLYLPGSGGAADNLAAGFHSRCLCRTFEQGLARCVALAGIFLGRR